MYINIMSDKYHNVAFSLEWMRRGENVWIEGVRFVTMKNIDPNNITRKDIRDQAYKKIKLSVEQHIRFVLGYFNDCSSIIRNVKVKSVSVVPRHFAREPEPSFVFDIVKREWNDVTKCQPLREVSKFGKTSLYIETGGDLSE